MFENQFASMHRQMVEQIVLYAHLAREEIGKDRLDQRVLAAMASVPRHEFVPVEFRAYAYLDTPLPIGFGKTISQPFMVALMTDLLDLSTDNVVLEVGTGLGYHAMVMAEISAKVYSVEIVEELAAKAQRNLSRVGCNAVEIRVGDCSLGWPEHGPFDAIVVAAGVELIPPMLLHQLKPGGRIVLPTGTVDAQQITLVEKGLDGKLSARELLTVSFGLLETAQPAHDGGTRIL